MVITWTYSAPANTATASGAGSTNFAGLVAADTAGGWGKFTADASGTQIKQAGKIVINAVSFVDTLKQITYANGVIAAGAAWVSLTNGGTYTLGIIQNNTLKTSTDGCQIIDLETTNYHYIYASALYSCTFSAPSNSLAIVNSPIMWNCLFVGAGIQLAQPSGTSDFFNCVSTHGGTGFDLGLGTFNKLTCLSPLNYYVRAYNIASDISVSNLYGRDCGNKALRVTVFSYNAYLINCDFDAWTISWGSSVASAKVFRQYEFDLTVRDSAGNPLEDATCTIDDAAATEIFNVDTDANGAITTQTVSRGYYNQANGDTLQDYGPHTLTITKAGYATYTAKVIFDMKLNLRIVLTSDAEAALYPALTGNASATDVLEGKTFYKDDAATQLTGTATFTVTTQMSTTETRVIYKKDPLRLPLMLATESLLIQNQRLKHKLRTQ
jgi:hypothetical protein